MIGGEGDLYLLIFAVRGLANDVVAIARRKVMEMRSMQEQRLGIMGGKMSIRAGLVNAITKRGQLAAW